MARYIALLSVSVSLADCVAQSFREELLGLARDRINVFYVDAGNLDDQKSESDVRFSLSKDNKACGDTGIPLTFVEYDVESDGKAEVRPVDVFNVLSDVLNQPHWDSFCAKTTFLGDFQQQQSRGYSALFTAKPFGNRELYEWQVAAANFTTEEFWLVFTSLDNDVLLQKKAPEPGSVPMLNCLGATRITKTAKGAHVIASNQPNSNAGVVDPRTVANIGWHDTVEFAVHVRQQAQEHAKLHWESNKTVLPKWMLEDRPCGAKAPNTDLKREYLAHAARRLGTPEAERGSKKTLSLEDGGSLQVWQGSGPCAVGTGAAQDMPLWQASFVVPRARPIEVFNVLVNKADETTWNSALNRVNLTGLSRGVRGLHEEFVFSKKLEPRELWEWQAASHNLTNDSDGGAYLIAIASASAPFTDSFSPKDVLAAQCLAAYQVSPGPAGGSVVNMTSHLNPKILFAPIISKMWPAIAEDTIRQFASALINESQRMAKQRAAGPAEARVDGGALALLAPPPPGRNTSATLADVLRATDSSRLRVFASLDIPQLLDTSNGSTWGAGEFHDRAAELLHVFGFVKANATSQEAAPFCAGLALDAITVQLQGQALASLQWRVLDQLAKQDCAGAHLPDINNNKSGSGLSLALIGACTAALVLCCLVCGMCCCRTWKRRRHDRRARAAAAALLEGSRVDSLAGMPPSLPGAATSVAQQGPTNETSETC